MTKELKIFLIAFLISSFLSFGINIFGKNLEDFLFWQETLKNPQVFLAQVNLSNVLSGQTPTSEQDTEENPENVEISAKSALSVLIASQERETILFEKESDKILPVASLTKLMVADIVLENYDISQIIEISKEAVSQEGDFGNLRVGESLSIENLLYIMLIESSNDATYALTETIGQEGFIELMNLEAKYIGMKDTFFEDSTGISPKTQSSPRDLVILTKHLLEKPLIWKVLATPELNLYTPDGVFHHKLLNTNEILRNGESDLEIIGGKTGYTPEAKGCFLLVLETPQGDYIINIILGSADRFGEMQKLIDFVKADARISH